MESLFNLDFAAVLAAFVAGMFLGAWFFNVDVRRKDDAPTLDDVKNLVTKK